MTVRPKRRNAVKGCKICRLNEERRKVGPQPTVICELAHGVVVLFEELNAVYPGASVYSMNEHVTELFNLTSEERKRTMDEVSLVAEAIYRAFRPKKINYALMGNISPHIHWVIVPRYPDDPPRVRGRPYWFEGAERPLKPKERERIKSILRSEIESLKRRYG